MEVELSAHQLTAVGKIESGKILKGGVGTGKSRTALAWAFTRELGGSLRIAGIGNYKPPREPKVIYIITTAKKRESLEWVREAAGFGISQLGSAGVSGVTVKVDSWNNVVKYTEVTDGIFFFDEQRLVGSGAWVKAFYKIAKNNRWIMLSATPGDTWMDYIPVFVANGFYKNRTEFIRRHVVYVNYTKFPKISHYVETGYLQKLRNKLIVDMPYKRHTKRHIHNVTVPHNEKLFERVWKDRWHIYEDRPVREVSELYAVGRRLVNSDPGRSGALLELIEKHPKLIVFYNFNYELDMLRILASTINYPVAEWNGQKHEDIPKTDKWLYLVQYTAGAEGWNCTETDAIAFWSLNYSYRITEQARGRIDRLNTPFVDLHYYVFRSLSKIDQGVWAALLKKKNFNEKDLVKEL